MAILTFATSPTRGYVRFVPWFPKGDGTTWYPSTDEAQQVVAEDCGEVCVIRHWFEDPSLIVDVDNQTDQAATYVGVWSYRTR